MDSVQKNFLNAIRQFIKPEIKAKLNMDTPEQLYSLMEMAQKQHVLPMVYDVVAQYDCGGDCVNIKNMYKKRAILEMVSQIQRTKMFFETYNVMLERGIKPIVVKGVVLRSMYDKPDFRCSNDEDILVDKKDFFKCDSILIEQGFEREVEESDLKSRELPYEIAYFNRKTKVRIEIHTKLLPDNSNAFKELNRNFKNVFDHAKMIDVGVGSVWTLSDTDHFLFLLSHSYKHFIYCGFGIRQLCDLLMMAEKCRNTIEWKYIERVARENRIYKFFINLLDIGEKYLGFDSCSIPFNLRFYVEPDSGNLLEDMLEAGVFGKSSIGRIHSANITMSAADRSFAENDRPKTVRLSIASSLFPPKLYMERNYLYLKKKGYLLPIAYFQRIRTYLKERKVQSRYSMEINSIAIGKKRIALMRQYGVI